MPTRRLPICNALEAVRLIHRHLPGTIAQESRSVDDMCYLMLGSLEAGLAFSNGYFRRCTCNGARFRGIAGHASWRVQRHFIGTGWWQPTFSPARNGMPRLPPPWVSIFTAKGDAAIRDALLAEICRLKQVVGITRMLGDIGLRREDIPTLAATAMKDACMATNPREMGQAEIEAVYLNAF